MDSLKLALITNDPSRMTVLYPSYVSTENTEETIQAMDSGAPMEIRTVVPADEAEEFFRMMEDGELTVTDLDGVFTPDDEGGDY